VTRFFYNANVDAVFDQVGKLGTDSSACVEYVSKPASTANYKNAIGTYLGRLAAKCPKEKTSLKEFISDNELSSPLSQDCQGNMTIKAQSGNISPQVTFSTSLHNFGLLSSYDFLATKKEARTIMDDCRKAAQNHILECKNRPGCNFGEFRGGVMLGCMYQTWLTKSSGSITRPGCKDAPKISLKIFLPELLNSINRPNSKEAIGAYINAHTTSYSYTTAGGFTANNDYQAKCYCDYPGRYGTGPCDGARVMDEGELMRGKTINIAKNGEEAMVVIEMRDSGAPLLTQMLRTSSVNNGATRNTAIDTAANYFDTYESKPFSKLLNTNLGDFHSI